MGAFLLSGGAKEKRYILPNARTMIHQPSGGAQGQATDIEIQAKEILFLRERLNGLLAEHTGQPIDVIERDTERDRFMSAEQSVEYGLVDEVISSILWRIWLSQIWMDMRRKCRRLVRILVGVTPVGKFVLHLQQLGALVVLFVGLGSFGPLQHRLSDAPSERPIKIGCVGKVVPRFKL